jgi:hypothetical protein
LFNFFFPLADGAESHLGLRRPKQNSEITLAKRDLTAAQAQAFSDPTLMLEVEVDPVTRVWASIGTSIRNAMRPASTIQIEPLSSVVTYFIVGDVNFAATEIVASRFVALTGKYRFGWYLYPGCGDHVFVWALLLLLLHTA